MIMKVLLTKQNIFNKDTLKAIGLMFQDTEAVVQHTRSANPEKFQIFSKAIEQKSPRMT